MYGTAAADTKLNPRDSFLSFTASSQFFHVDFSPRLPNVLTAK